MYEIGGPGGTTRMNRASKAFDKLGTALMKIAAPMKILSNFLTHLGISFVVFAAGLVVSSLLLKLSTPTAIIGTLIGVVVALVGIFGILSLTKKFIQPGIDIINGIGEGFKTLVIGILGFAVGVLLLAAYMGTGNGFKGTLKALLVLSGVVLIVVGMFALLGLAKKLVKPGIAVVKGMGVGFLFLIGGILLFMFGLIGAAALMGGSKNGAGIALALGAMAITVGALVGLFWVLGKAKKQVAMGTLVAIMVAIGIMAIGYSVKYLADVAKHITGLGDEKATKKDGTSRGPFGKMMAGIGPGLGMVGLVFVAAAGLFAILGIKAVAMLVGLGAVVAIGVSAALLLLATAVKKLSDVSSKLKPDFPKKLAFMIGGVFTGMLAGMSVLTGGKVDINGDITSGGANGFKKFTTFVKNSYKILAVTGLLMTTSIALSMFAKALTAFANLDNMRVIEGYDEKTGKPKFGEKVDIKNVGTTISTTISQFLKALIDSTENLQNGQSRKIKKMGAALVGRNGILSAVIQFADVLKTYAQFGPKKEIGYAAFQYDAKGDVILDSNGEPKMITKTVSIVDVTNGIVGSFMEFVTQLVDKTKVFEFGGSEKRKMQRVSEALLGKKRSVIGGLVASDKPGLLEPIERFSSVLQMYAKIGADGGLPVLNEDGSIVMEGDKPKTISMADIAGKIATSLTSFITEFEKTTKLNATDQQIKSVEKKMEKYQAIINNISGLAVMSEGLNQTAVSIGQLATNIGLLSSSLDALNPDKLKEIGNLKNISINNNGSGVGTSAQNISSSNSNNILPPPPDVFGPVNTAPKTTTPAKTSTPAISPTPTFNTQELADAIGKTVAAAFKSGHFKFEFATNNSGVYSFE
jgi:hypothetical protein